MASRSRPNFSPGTNVAMKVPPRLFEAMVAFYGETLGLTVAPDGDSMKVDFGAVTLWLDKVSGMTQPELWLELQTTDTEAAAAYLKEKSVPRCDEVEALPPGSDGFWIAAPGGIVHLVWGGGSK